MSIKFQCPGCGKSFEVDDRFAGKAAKCHACGAKMRVPAAESESPGAGEQPAAARSGPRTWLVLAGVLGVLAVAAAGVYVYVRGAGGLGGGAGQQAGGPAGGGGPGGDGLPPITADKQRWRITEPTPAGSRIGYIDRTGKVVIPPVYVAGGQFHDGCARVAKPGSQTRYYINRDGEIIFQGEPIEVKGLAGTITKNWQCREFSEGLAAVGEPRPGLQLHRFGYIDPSGEFVIERQFTGASDFLGGVAVVGVPVKERLRSRKTAYINKAGEFITKEEYDQRRYAHKFMREGRMPKFLRSEGATTLYCYVDESGKTVIAGPFTHPALFSGGRARVQRGSGSGTVYQVIDRAGKVIPMPRGDASRVKTDFREGMAVITFSRRQHTAVPRHKTWGSGFVDVNGKLVIPPRFEDARNFSEGLAAVKVDGKWGFIDRAGRMVIPPQWPVIDNDFHGGIVAVPMRNAPAAYVDRMGRRVWEAKK